MSDCVLNTSLCSVAEADGVKTRSKSRMKIRDQRPWAGILKSRTHFIHWSLFITPENRRFSDVFCGYKKRTVALNSFKWVNPFRGNRKKPVAWNGLILPNSYSLTRTKTLIAIQRIKHSWGTSLNKNDINDVVLVFLLLT